MMMVYNLVERIKKGMAGLNKGLSTGMTKLDNLVFGIQKGWITTVCGSSGSGKSSFVIDVYVYQALKQMLGDDRLKIIYYSLELSSEVLLAKLLSLYIWDTHKVKIPYTEMLSMDKVLSADKFGYINNSLDWLNEASQHLIIHDKGISADGIYAHLKTHFESRGNFIEVDEHKTVYKHKYEDHVTIAIVDHVRLLTVKGGGPPKPEIDKMCKYLITMRNKCGLSAVLVQQQNRNAQGMDRKKAGLQELQLDDLSDTSDTAQASEVVIGVYNPFREKDYSWKDYKIKDGLNDRARGIQIMKNRFGMSDKVFGVGFYGEIGCWRELPSPAEMNFDKSLYEKFSDVANVDKDDQRNKDVFVKPEKTEHESSFGGHKFKFTL